MFRPLITIRRIPNINFMGLHKLGFALSLLLTVGSIVLFLVQGLNYGIDFSGGTRIDIKSLDGPADLGKLRSTLDGLGLGNMSLQGLDAADEVVMIRFPRQPGDDQAQQTAVTKVKQALGDHVEYRRTEVVGPTVGKELIRAGVMATVLALLAIAAYVWLRFEWQFGIGAMLSTVHDTVTTVGLFALLQIEFNLTTLAAILTVAGYSINDTVVIYDRVRETMRKHRSMDFNLLINKSLNETLSRTILTVSTVALAVLSLLIFGGEVLRGFSIAMLWGIVVGTYSSLFIAAPLLYYIRPRGGGGAQARDKEADAVPAEAERVS
jgi:preprotein translocase subunit SecF